jgi:hypothetical protein
VLKAVPEAGRVSIWDTSAQVGHIIAIAAVFRKAGTKNVRPVPTLLLFDFGGGLQSAFALEPSREIQRLEVDEKSNIWTISSHSGGKNPSTVPMVVKYTSEGTIAMEMLARDKFPFHAEATQQSQEIGSTFIGYDSDGLWFWLPGSTELVTISADGSKSTVVKTQLPHWDGSIGEHPVRILRANSQMVAQFGETSKQGIPSVANYTWSADNGWSRFEPGSCAGSLMVGSNGRELVFVQRNAALANRFDICVSTAQGIGSQAQARSKDRPK